MDNETITIEPCPTCKAIATCKHLSGTHIWDCPNCGEIIATVMYECYVCATGEAVEEAGTRKHAPKQSHLPV
jgi:ribosomal protein L37AE/L43A